MTKLAIWQKASLLFFAGGAGYALYLYFSVGGSGAPEAFTGFLIAGFAAWLGAAIGIFIDWKVTGRSPFSPFFKGSFDWYYKSRYWFRFGILFGAAWVGFLAFAEALALAVGEKEEALLFITPKGALLLLIFVVIFVVEGALIGALLDFFKYLARKDDGQK